MLQYVDNIIAPYVERVREMLGENKAAVVIMDNFKGQIVDSVINKLEDLNILVCLLPPNTTDRLQPLDIAVNKPAKTSMKGKFEEWYAYEVVKQLEGQNGLNEIIPVDLGLPCLKELGGQWLVEMKEYISHLYVRHSTCMPPMFRICNNSHAFIYTNMVATIVGKNITSNLHLHN